MASHPVQTVSGVVTSWIPLTTGSPPPPACSSAIYSQQGGGELIAFDPVLQVLVPSFTSSCFPTQATDWYNQGSPPLPTITSLGPFACPGGYTTAFTTTEKSSTHIACCPSYVLYDPLIHLTLTCASDYVYQGSFVDHGTIGECWSTPTDGATIRYFTLTDTGTWSETSTVLSSTHVVGVQINGYNFATPTTSSSTTSSTSSSTTSSTSSSTTSSTSSSSPSTTPALPGASVNPNPASPTNSASSSHGLSSGSKIAIGVGLTLAIVGIACLVTVWMLFRRRRRAQQLPAAESNALFADRGNSPNEVEGNSFFAAQVHDPKEVHGMSSLRAELNGQHEPAPAPPPVIHEMSGAD
jgi:hypothetical protein